MELKKIKNVANVLTGFPFKGELYSNKGIKVVRGENVTEGKLRWDTIKCWNLPFDKKDYYSLQKDDIVIGMDGSKVGKNKARIKKENLPLLLAQRVACIRSKSNLNQVFLYYCINNTIFEDYVFRIQTGSSVPHISKTQIEEFKIPFPVLEAQISIAKTLSDLDAKIDLNNQINQELEAMAKTLYEYWFVQFDFPNEEGKPYKSSGGKMVYNEELKREIPEGWEVKELSDIANITMGQSPSGSSYNDNGIGEIFFQGSTDFGWRYPTIRQYTSEPNRMAIAGDILLSVRAPVGTLNIADNNCCIGRGLAALNSKEGYDSYLYYVMEYFKQIFDYRNSSGTTFGSINKDDLFSLKLVYPKRVILKKYNNIVSKYNQMILNNHKQNQQLAELRDWLLPMLMNGQVKVKDAKVVEEELGEALGVVAEGQGEYCERI